MAVLGGEDVYASVSAIPATTSGPHFMMRRCARMLQPRGPALAWTRSLRQRAE